MRPFSWFIAIRRGVFGALLLFLPGLASAQAEGDESGRALYRIGRLEAPAVTIDGRLDEASWQHALSVPLMVESSPGDGVVPPVQTDVYLMYDRRHLYLGFRAWDPRPQAIRAHLMDRDEVGSLEQDDFVGFTLDTFDAQRRAFKFRVNPFGVQADGIFSQLENTSDYSWDIIWDSAGRVDDQGYVVEVAIPFDQLRFPRSSGSQIWGIDLERFYPREFAHVISASHRQRGNNCVLCQAPRFEGFEGLEPGLNLEVAPTTTFTRSDAIGSSGRLEDGDEEVEGGISARWGITPELTLNATINPDFSQVEADVAQLEVNERFALFFPEQRPFFLEGKDFFDTQIPVVRTRTIVDPDWGLKLTGKVGANALGFFSSGDDVNNVLLSSSENSLLASLPGEVTTSVARLRRDVGTASTFGVIYAGREGEDDYHNRVAGLDSFMRFGANHSLKIDALFSDTRYPDAAAQAWQQTQGDFGGHSVEALYQYTSREWDGFLGYRDFGRGFRADSGFVPRTDFKTWIGRVQRSFWGQEGDWYTKLQTGVQGLTTRNQAGRLVEEQIELFGTFFGGHQSFLDLSFFHRDQASRGQLFSDLSRGRLDFRIQPSGATSFGLFAEIGEDVDVVNGREGDKFLVQPQMQIKIGDHLNAQLDYEYRSLGVEGGELFVARLAQLRLVYQFDVRTFIRAIVQYLDVDFEPSLYRISNPPQDEEELFAQLLFSYKINPQTVLFAGYSDTESALDSAVLERTGRTFFLKLGYVWTH